MASQPKGTTQMGKQFYICADITTASQRPKSGSVLSVALQVIGKSDAFHARQSPSQVAAALFSDADPRGGLWWADGADDKARGLVHLLSPLTSESKEIRDAKWWVDSVARFHDGEPVLVTWDAPFVAGHLGFCGVYFKGAIDLRSAALAHEFLGRSTSLLPRGEGEITPTTSFHDLLSKRAGGPPPSREVRDSLSTQIDCARVLFPDLFPRTSDEGGE